MMSTIALIGIRVVRGVDWQWKDQDGGIGYVGTIIEVGGQGKNNNPPDTVVVLWDSGQRGLYRAGYDFKDDLRVLDNGPAGVFHQSVKCDGCNLARLSGIRWKCSQCTNFDLCHNCYMGNQHDTNHKFLRIDTPQSVRVQVPSRKLSTAMQAKGIYVGATVERGSSWQWGDQDGGAGKTGKVISVNDPTDSSSGRSYVKVRWDTGGMTNDYRRGHEGHVDVKYKTASIGGSFYEEHLPKLEEYQANVLKTGDSVWLVLSAMSKDEEDQMIQAGVYNQKGQIDEYRPGKGFVVSFSGKPKRYVLSPHLLSKTQSKSVAVGDSVKIISNVNELRNLQNNHGGFNDQIAAVAGQIGRVISIDGDGDVKVEVGGRSWLFNPQCCIPVTFNIASTTDRASRPPSKDVNNQDNSVERSNSSGVSAGLSMLDMLMALQSAGPFSPGDLIKSAAQGNVSQVRAIVKRFPDKVNTVAQNLTALHVASNGGHLQVVDVLLEAGARLDVTDGSRNTPFHYAVDSNQAKVVEKLAAKSSSAINNVNDSGLTALHLAVYKQHADCVSILLRHGANINVQDKVGDTALHDAIRKPSSAIVSMLLSTNKVQYQLQNKDGFNVVHLAAKAGDHLALKEMLPKLPPNLVNLKKSDGLTALHLAALNGNQLSATVLIDVGKADLEINDGSHRTPLLVAVSSGQAHLIELLAEKGADLEATDSDGDTSLRNVLLFMKNSRQSTDLLSMIFNMALQKQPKEMNKAPTIFKIYTQLGGKGGGSDATLAWLAVACYLVGKGADLGHRNHSGKSPLDEVPPGQIRSLLISLSSNQQRPAVVSPQIKVVDCAQM